VRAHEESWKSIGEGPLFRANAEAQAQEPGFG
jgi:hypothetical protein